VYTTFIVRYHCGHVLQGLRGKGYSLGEAGVRARSLDIALHGNAENGIEIAHVFLSRSEQKAHKASTETLRVGHSSHGDPSSI
jgi:hypothetical protein